MEQVIRKVEAKLEAWKTKLLSLGGLILLIKALLTSIPLWFLSTNYQSKLGRSTIEYEGIFFGNYESKKSQYALVQSGSFIAERSKILPRFSIYMKGLNIGPQHSGVQLDQ